MIRVNVVAEGQEAITVEAIRKKCPHFSAWLRQLQALGD